MRNIPIPKESEEQTALMQWAELSKGKHPALEWLYHIPNGGSRHKLEAVHLKRQGVKSGVPDLCLPVPRGRYHGLYIELKRTKGGRLSDEQRKWIETLEAQGYRAVECRGWKVAADVIIEYLGEGN